MRCFYKIGLLVSLSILLLFSATSCQSPPPITQAQLLPEPYSFILPVGALEPSSEYPNGMQVTNYSGDFLVAHAGRNRFLYHYKDGQHQLILQYSKKELEITGGGTSWGVPATIIDHKPFSNISTSRVGLIGTDGSFLLPPVYDSVMQKTFLDGTTAFYAYTDTQGFLLFEDGTRLNMPDDVKDFVKINGHYYFITTDDKYLTDQNGKKLFPGYKNFSFFSTTAVIACNSDGKYGVIRFDGTIQVPFTHHSLSAAPVSLRAAEERYLYEEDTRPEEDQRRAEETAAYNGAKGRYDLEGYQKPAKRDILLDEHGNRLFDQYDRVKPVGNGHFLIQQNEACGLVDSANHLLLPLDYQAITPVQLPDRVCYIVQKDDNNNQLLDAQLQPVLPNAYKTIIPLYQDTRLLLVNNDGLYGCASADGTILLPCEYELLRDARESGILIAKKNKRFTLLDRDLQQITQDSYLDILSYQNGFAAAKKATGWGYLNISGEPVLPFICDSPELASSKWVNLHYTPNIFRLPIPGGGEQTATIIQDGGRCLCIRLTG